MNGLAVRPESSVTGLALCAGVGGLELGLSRAIRGYRCVCFVEKDEVATQILRGRQQAGELDDAPVWDDLATFDGGRWRGADLISAGFPCQPFSTASRGRRTAADLWPQVLRVILEVGPRVVFLENVQRKPIERAANDLWRTAGYRCFAGHLDAAALGAPARRVRWWLFAHLDDAEQSALALDAEVAGVSAARQTDEWARRPDRILGMDARVPNRVDRLRCLGNAVVPAQAELAFRVLAERAGLAGVR